MSNEIQKFDLTQVIRDRVRSVILDTIPNEQIDAMIEAEFDAYFKEYKRNRHAAHFQPSRFSVLLEKLITAEMGNRIKIWLSENFDAAWSMNGTVLIGDLVEEFVPIVQAKMASDVVSRALSEIKSQFNQYN